MKAMLKPGSLAQGELGSILKGTNKIINYSFIIIYHFMMSEKAVGRDWKRKSIPTLRHAAGCDKYIK